MTVVQWDPLRELLALKDRMNKIIENAMSRSQYGGSADAGTWSPAVDIFETSESVVVAAELPGLSPSEIEVRIAENMLTLKGERKLEKGIEQENYHRIERSYGSFSRSLPLPPGIKPSEARAEYRLGILHIQIPKAREAGASPVHIRIS
ncbi:MAG: molecular chaperone [Acidobacteria bacterium]|nr:MAG: molecular chaperone [Acidobacteriota bacterium]